LDLIACFMAGVQNVVAPQGTAFTGDHARILKRYVEEVVLCFDSDVAGQNATVRSLDHLLASELAVRVAVIPAPDDPDSFIKTRGGEEFKKLIANAAGFYDYYLERLCRENDVTTDRGRLGVLRDMAEAVTKSRNGVLIDKYAQKTALRLGVTPDAVRLEFKKTSVVKPVRSAPAEDMQPEPEAVVVRPSASEAWLLKVLLMHQDVAGWAVSHLNPAWIEHPLVKQAVTQLLQIHREQSWQSLAAFLADCPNPQLQQLITEVSTTDKPVPNPEIQLKDIATRLRNQFITRQIARIVQQLADPALDDEQRVSLLHQLQDLRALKGKSIENAP
jgi:DNA primase